MEVLGGEPRTIGPDPMMEVLEIHWTREQPHMLWAVTVDGGFDSTGMTDPAMAARGRAMPTPTAEVQTGRCKVRRGR